MRTKKTPFNKRKIEKLVRELIVQLGENPDREGLIGTPQRMANMFEEIFAGYCMNSELEISFSEETDSIIAKDIRFYSMCEHHMYHFLAEYTLLTLLLVGYLEFRNLHGLLKNTQKDCKFKKDSQRKLQTR